MPGNYRNHKGRNIPKESLIALLLRPPYEYSMQEAQKVAGKILLTISDQVMSKGFDLSDEKSLRALIRGFVEKGKL